jgi:hypothetical protein
MNSKSEKTIRFSEALHTAMLNAKDQPSPKLKKIEHLIPRMTKGLMALDELDSND